MSAETEIEREMTDHEINLLIDMIEAKTAMNVAEETYKKCRDQLSASMDFYTHGLVDGVHVVTVARSRPERFDSRRFREDHPILAKGYVAPAAQDTVLVVARPAAALLDRPTPR